MRASSENMPEDGREAFADIRAAIAAYIPRANEQETADTPAKRTATLKVLNTRRSTMQNGGNGTETAPRARGYHR